MSVFARPHAKLEDALALAREGVMSGEIASRLGVTDDTVRRWCRVANVPLPVCRVHHHNWAIIEECATRNANGETIAKLAREHNISEKTLLQQARTVQAKRADKERGVVEEPPARRERKRYAPVLEVREQHERPTEPPRWLRDIRPAGRTVTLTLADDGMGEVRLMARIEGGRETVQESYSVTSPDWRERVLQHLAGLLVGPSRLSPGARE